MSVELNAKIKWGGSNLNCLPSTEKKDGIDATGEKPVASTVSGHFESHKFITKTKDAMPIFVNPCGFEPYH